MKRFIIIFLAVVILAGCFAACAPVETESPSPTDVPTQKPDLNKNPVTDIGSTVFGNSFDDALLSYISSKCTGNYMVSPLSFRYALGLLAAGANGETLNELLKAFGVESLDKWTEYCLDFNGFIDKFEENLQKETEDFNHQVELGWISKDSPAPYRALSVANSIWKREDIQADFKEEYKDYVVKNYNAEYRTFNPSNAVSLINKWASDKTEKMIEKLLDEDYDASELALVLMNALYFKSAWSLPFPKSDIENNFTTKAGTKVKKKFMTVTETFRYYKDGDTQLVILPMKGNVYMTFVLGSTDNLSDKIEAAKYCSVKVTIPKIDLETSFDNREFVDFLFENGVKCAFSPDLADFSNMIDYPIYVDDIIQKTRIKLDEDGVEAAAVTAIMAKNSAVSEPVEPEIFTADRPFSFFIYSTVNKTTAMMFAGEIVE